MWSRLTLTMAGAAGALLLLRIGLGPQSRALRAPLLSSAVESGAHWANPSDFRQLKRLGFQFAVVSLNRDEAHWETVFREAERAGIRLIAGIHPYPYRLEAGQWVIEPVGLRFIEFARKHSVVVKALYGFSEPYWVDPSTGVNTPCGAHSAAELRDLRKWIRRIWPEARLYHDFGRPSLWAPGGAMERDHGCVGNRYADASGVADYAGIWFYPVSGRQGYQREELVRSMREEVAYVTLSMRAEPIVLGQAFRCEGCGEGTRMPTVNEARDINCTLRWIAPHAISWYLWRQPPSRDTLIAHPELWEAIDARGCPDGNG